LNAFNNLEQSPLMAACEAARGDIVRRLLQRGAKVHAVDTAGRSALHLAVAAGDRGIALKLIEVVRARNND
jgi:ankyrin repeat protein